MWWFSVYLQKTTAAAQTVLPTSTRACGVPVFTWKRLQLSQVQHYSVRPGYVIFFWSVYLGKATAATGVALPRSAGVCDFDVFTVCAAIRIVLTLLPRQPVIPFPTLL